MARLGELRGGAPAGASVHARLPGIMAQLQAGWEMWLQFALEVGAIRNSEQLQLLQRGRKQQSPDVRFVQIPHHAVHRFFEGGFLYLDRDAVGQQSPDLPFVQINQSVPEGEDHLCPSDLRHGTAMQNVA